jgi:hypothetical protein
MKSLSITTSEHFLNLTSPTDSSEEAKGKDKPLRRLQTTLSPRAKTFVSSWKLLSLGCGRSSIATEVGKSKSNDWASTSTCTSAGFAE